MQTSFTISYPKLIHPQLIAVLADLQSTVIYNTDGVLLGWIHEGKKNIEFAEGYGDMYRILIKESELKDVLTGYNLSFFKIDGTISYRKWDVKTKFIYPPAPQVTVQNENEW
jgi:hypothetical protein